MAGDEELGARSLLYVGGPEGQRQLAVDPLSLYKVDFKSKQQLLAVLEEHRHETVDVHVDDVIDMVAELRGSSRADVLRMAVVAWFHHALGFRVLEVECKEQPRTDDSSGGLLLFRIRLNADYAKEVAKLASEQDRTAETSANPQAARLTAEQELARKYRDILIAALPGDLVARKGASSLEQMLQISWTRSGDLERSGDRCLERSGERYYGGIELGGVAALGLVILIVMALGVGTCRCELCSFCGVCPCVSRGGRFDEGCALRELRDRGAEFEVSPDGSANLREPPFKDARWRCPDCVIL